MSMRLKNLAVCGAQIIENEQFSPRFIRIFEGPGINKKQIWGIISNKVCRIYQQLDRNIFCSAIKITWRSIKTFSPNSHALIYLKRAHIVDNFVIS